MRLGLTHEEETQFFRELVVLYKTLPLPPADDTLPECDHDDEESVRAWYKALRGGDADVDGVTLCAAILDSVAPYVISEDWREDIGLILEISGTGGDLLTRVLREILTYVRRPYPAFTGDLRSAISALLGEECFGHGPERQAIYDDFEAWWSDHKEIIGVG